MPSRAQTIVVRVSPSYPVYVGAGLVRHCGRWLRKEENRRLFVFSSPRIWRYVSRVVRRGLAHAGIPYGLLLMDDREEKKSLATVEQLARRLVRRGADRTSRLMAVGGGVVGDVVGFLAASFMRGVDYIQVPTTLVAQIDSAIGGKTGVNLPEGKNLVGAFHHPRFVLVDPTLLSSLLPREFQAGLYELIKYGVIGDRGLFAFLERRLETVKRREPAVVARVLGRAIRQKARIVAADERERGLRQVLNFGHTFGHALEALTAYRRFRHGEAVGWGMLMATRLAERLERISASDARRIAAVVDAAGRLPALPQVAPERVLAQMQADKKRQGGALVFVLPRGIGRVEVTAGVPQTALRATLREFLRR